MESKNETKKVSIIQKMIEDKRAIHEYIKRNGSLKGFRDERIKFAKPF
jgi:hypothetical protein